MRDQDVDYIIRFEHTYDTVPQADQALENLVKVIGWNPDLSVSYVMVELQFKDWIPKWIRKVLTK